MTDNIYLKKQISYPDFMTRVMASLFDIIILSFLLYPLFNIAKGFFLKQDKSNILINKIADKTTGQEANLDLFKETSSLLVTDPYFYNLIWNSIFQYVVIMAVLIFCWSYYSTSFGKRIFSLMIVDEKTLGKISLKQAIIRMISYPVSVLPCFLGIFAINFTKKKQAWHDKIAGTLVIKK